MAGNLVPTALRTRLGDDATFGMIERLDAEGKDWSTDVLTMASERFETRLAQEVGGIRQEIAETRVEILRWSFVFWIGQVAAVAGLLAYMRH